MGNRLYVGNLSYHTTRENVETIFAQHGSVEEVDLIADRETGQSKGFGFVQMASDQEAQAAITALNEQEIDGRKLTVNEARPRAERQRFASSYGRSENRGYAGGRGGENRGYVGRSGY